MFPQSGWSWKASHWICHNRRTPKPQVKHWSCCFCLDADLILNILTRDFFFQVGSDDPGTRQSGAHLRAAGLQQIPPRHHDDLDPLPCWYLQTQEQLSSLIILLFHPTMFFLLFFLQSCATAAMHPEYYVFSDGRLQEKWKPTRGW